MGKVPGCRLPCSSKIRKICFSCVARACVCRRDDPGQRVAHFGLLSEKMGSRPSILLSRTTSSAKPDETNQNRFKNEDRFRRGSSRHLAPSRPYAKFREFRRSRPFVLLPQEQPDQHALASLTLLNDQAYVEMALGFAASIIEQMPVRRTGTQCDGLFARLFPGDQPRRRFPSSMQLLARNAID